MRVWLRRAELDAILTRRTAEDRGLREVDVDCRRSNLCRGLGTLELGRFHGDTAPGSDHDLVRAVAGGVVSTMREIYNVVD